MARRVAARKSARRLCATAAAGPTSAAPSARPHPGMRSAAQPCSPPAKRPTGLLLVMDGGKGARRTIMGHGVRGGCLGELQTGRWRGEHPQKLRRLPLHTDALPWAPPSLGGWVRVPCVHDGDRLARTEKSRTSGGSATTVSGRGGGALQSRLRVLARGRARVGRMRFRCPSPSPFSRSRPAALTSACTRGPGLRGGGCGCVWAAVGPVEARLRALRRPSRVDGSRRRPRPGLPPPPPCRRPSPASLLAPPARRLCCRTGGDDNDRVCQLHRIPPRLLGRGGEKGEGERRLSRPRSSPSSPRPVHLPGRPRAGARRSPSHARPEGPCPRRPETARAACPPGTRRRRRLQTRTTFRPLLAGAAHRNGPACFAFSGSMTDGQQGGRLARPSLPPSPCVPP